MLLGNLVTQLEWNEFEGGGIDLLSCDVIEDFALK